MMLIKCRYCNREFDKPSHRNQHERDVHKNRKPNMNNDQLKKVAIEALETCAIGSGGANGFTKTYWFDEQKVKAAIAALTAAQSAHSEKEKLFDYLTTLATDAGFPNISTAIADARWVVAAQSAGKDEREDFEAWVHERYVHPEEVLRNVTSYAWDAWQARASLAKVQAQKPVAWSEAVARASDGALYVFKDSCNHTQDAIEYMKQVMLAAAPQAQHSDAWHRLVISLGCMFGFETSGSIDEVAASARDVCDKQAQQEAGKDDVTADECIELAEALCWESMRQAIAGTRNAASLLEDASFRIGMETAYDEIETRLNLASSAQADESQECDGQCFKCECGRMQADTQQSKKGEGK